MILMYLPYGPNNFWGRRLARVGDALLVVSPIAFRWYRVHRIVRGFMCVDD